MWLPVIIGVGAGLFALLAGKKETGKTFDDGVKAGRKAAEDEAKVKEDEVKRLAAIARKQVRLESRRSRYSRHDEEESDTAGGSS